MNEKEIASRLEAEFVGTDWDIVDWTVTDEKIAVCAENETLDQVRFTLTVTDVEFEPGPPSRDDFEPDRIEPGEGESPW